MRLGSRSPPHAACPRRASCCRPAAASATAGSRSIAATRAWLLAPPAGDSRRADPRQRHGHALGRHARRPRRCRRTSDDPGAAALPREADELNLQRMLSYTQQGYWQFSRPPDARRAGAAARAACSARASTPPTSSLKSAWFSALARHGAQTPATLGVARAHLAAGRNGARPDAGGAGLHHAGGGARGARRAGRGRRSSTSSSRGSKNPDRKARFAFVRPALSPDPRDPRRVLRQPSRRANRRREPWVLEALRYLHHPLRADASHRYIPPSLAMLREIQRTGDIFFPKRWMDATLSGHSSVERRAIGQDVPRRCRRTIRTGSGGSSCRRPTTCSARSALDGRAGRSRRAHATAHVGTRGDDTDEHALKLRTCDTSSVSNEAQAANATGSRCNRKHPDRPRPQCRKQAAAHVRNRRQSRAARLQHAALRSVR